MMPIPLFLQTRLIFWSKPLVCLGHSARQLRVCRHPYVGGRDLRHLDSPSRIDSKSSASMTWRLAMLQLNSEQSKRKMGFDQTSQALGNDQRAPIARRLRTWGTAAHGEPVKAWAPERVCPVRFSRHSQSQSQGQARYAFERGFAIFKLLYLGVQIERKRRNKDAACQTYDQLNASYPSLPHFCKLDRGEIYE